MEKSESLKNIAKALVLFHVKVGKVSKDATNPFFKSKYATLSNILDIIAEPLAESGLAFSQLPEGETGLTTILIHEESGEYLQSTYTMPLVKNDPQSKGSAITYQRRYALASILGLNIDDDDDANGAMPSTPQQQPPQQFEAPKNWLNKFEADRIMLTNDWKLVVNALSTGRRTLEQVKAAYKINKDALKELEAIKPNALSN